MSEEELNRDFIKCQLKDINIKLDKDSENILVNKILDLTTSSYKEGLNQTRFEKEVLEYKLEGYMKFEKYIRDYVKRLKKGDIILHFLTYELLIQLIDKYVYDK